jgi:hypothetical protein
VDVMMGYSGADTFVRDTDPAVQAQEAALWDYDPGQDLLI